MIRIFIGSAVDPKEVLADPNAKLKDVFQTEDVRIPTNATMMHNTKKLGDEDLNRTLTELSVEQDDTISLIEKQNGSKE